MPESSKKRARPSSDAIDASENGDRDEEEAGVIDEVDNEGESSTSAIAKPNKPKAGAAVKSKKRKSSTTTPSPGIVYISRVPPGMTPQKVRHLMGRWGEIGRVYAQRRDAPSGYDPQAHNKPGSSKSKSKHQSANFTEAWVEFADKSVGKTVARMLNAEVIGGKKGDRWRDDIWTMKYLSGFKWEMLGEQVAYERQAHQARLRAEITRSRAEQSDYLKNVELARVLDKRKAKKEAAGEGATTTGSAAGVGAGGGDGGSQASKKVNGGGGEGGEPESKRKKYKQREVVDRGKGLEGKGMDSVLGSVFG